MTSRSVDLILAAIERSAITHEEVALRVAGDLHMPLNEARCLVSHLIVDKCPVAVAAAIISILADRRSADYRTGARD